MRSAFAAVAAVFVSCTICSGQTVYEPVQVQFGGQNPYYYGGSDPQIHLQAAGFENAAGTFGRVNGFAFVSSTRAVSTDRPRVYSDLLGPSNALPYGYNADDAVNDANARLPRYFSKRALRASAVVKENIRVVPADAPRRARRDSAVYPPLGRAPRRAILLIIPRPAYETSRQVQSPASAGRPHEIAPQTSPNTSSTPEQVNK